MEVIKTTLRDVWLIKPGIHTDFRGDYVMTWREDIYCYEMAQGFKEIWRFIEHDVSYSGYGVLRGIHYSPSCWKLNHCLCGAIYYVVVNCDESDEEFGKWEAFILDDRKHHQLLKHPRYGSGFYVLSDHAVFHYMQSQYYDRDNPDQKTFKWDDPRFDIWWPDKNPILSRRDDTGEYITH